MMRFSAPRARWPRLVLLPLLALLAGAGGAMAQAEPAGQRLALSIALPDSDDRSGDALAVSQAALAAGFDVRRLDHPAVLPPAPETAPEVALLYLSGRAGRDGDGATVGGQSLRRTAEAWAAAGRLILLAETCGTGAAVDAGDLPAPPANALLAVAHAPDGSCGETRLTDTLIAALADPGAEIGAALDQAGFTLARGRDWAGFVALPEGTAPPVLTLPPAPAGETLATPPAAAAAGATVFSAAAITAFPGDRLTRPTPPGLPEPSVIVGDPPQDGTAIPPEEAAPADAAAALAGQTLGTGAEDRLRLQAENPALFDSLLAAGAFDPDAAGMATAIQQELARLDCYAGGVDGVWGPGSRAAVDRFAAEAEAPGLGREPDAALFRAIAAAGDVRCPPPPRPAAAAAPAPAPAAAAAPARATPGRQPAAPRATPAARQPAPAVPRQPVVRQPAPAPQPPQPARRIDPNAIGSGVFR